jgi:hypothetical protein
MKRTILLLGCILVLSLVAAGAAIPITSPCSAKVEVKYVSTEAAYSNYFGLWSPFFQTLGQGHVTPTGTIFDLGNFSPGDNLIFFIKNDLSQTFLSEGPSYDGVVHGQVSLIGDNLYRIGFEDLANGGDFDYNDIILTVEIIPYVPVPVTPAVAVPEFPTALVPVSLLAGLIGCIWFIRTRNA